MVGFLKLLHGAFVQFSLEEKWPESELMAEQLGTIPSNCNCRHPDEALCLKQADIPLSLWSLLPPVHGHACNCWSNCDCLCFHGKKSLLETMGSIFRYRGGNKAKEPAPCDQVTLCRPSPGTLWTTHSAKCSLGAAGSLKVTAAVQHAEKGLTLQNNAI